MEHINIVTAGDLHVFSGIELMLASAAHFSKVPINFYILSGELQDSKKIYKSLQQQQEYLEKLIKSYNINNTLTVIDCKEKYEAEHLEKAIGKFEPYAFLKVIQYLWLKPDKYLFVDADCFMLNDIQDLCNLLTDDLNLVVSKNQNVGAGFDSGLFGINLNREDTIDYLKKVVKACKIFNYKYPDFYGMNAVPCKYIVYDEKYKLPENLISEDLNNYIIHCYREENIIKPYSRYGDEQEQENYFWENFKNLDFLHQEILQKRKELNYKYIPGYAEKKDI